VERNHNENSDREPEGGLKPSTNLTQHRRQPVVEKNAGSRKLDLHATSESVTP